MKENKKDDLTEVNEALLKVLDDLLEEDGWQASQVLKVSAKKIEALRNDAEQLLNDQKKNKAEVSKGISMQEDMDGFVPVYVVLYQANKATTLDKWHDRIASLPNHHINLPIYEKEKTVIKVLKNKANRENYAYIEVLIEEGKINPNGKVQKDAEGNDLLTLQGNAICLNHIRWFCDGKSYFAFDKENGFEKIDR